MSPQLHDRRRTDESRPGIHDFSDELLERAWPSFLGNKISRRTLLVTFTAAILWIDYLTGAVIRFPSFYLPAVLLFAWYDGFIWGTVAACGIVLTRFALERWIWTGVPWPFTVSLMNASTAVLITFILVWFASRAGRLTREVRFLWGFLPICVYCQRIRDSKNHWEKLEVYVTDRSRAEFTHGICPSCIEERNLSL